MKQFKVVDNDAIMEHAPVEAVLHDSQMGLEFQVSIDYREYELPEIGGLGGWKVSKNGYWYTRVKGHIAKGIIDDMNCKNINWSGGVMHIASVIDAMLIAEA